MLLLTYPRVYTKVLDLYVHTIQYAELLFLSQFCISNNGDCGIREEIHPKNTKDDIIYEFYIVQYTGALLKRVKIKK